MGKKFEYGQRVVDVTTGDLFDFGYMNQFGDAVVYYPGERNMQDSTVIPIKDLLAVQDGGPSGRNEDL